MIVGPPIVAAVLAREELVLEVELLCRRLRVPRIERISPGDSTNRDRINCARVVRARIDKGGVLGIAQHARFEASHQRVAEFAHKRRILAIENKRLLPSIIASLEKEQGGLNVGREVLGHEALLLGRALLRRCAARVNHWMHRSEDMVHGNIVMRGLAQGVAREVQEETAIDQRGDFGRRGDLGAPPICVMESCKRASASTSDNEVSCCVEVATFHQIVLDGLKNARAAVPDHLLSDLDGLRRVAREGAAVAVGHVHDVPIPHQRVPARSGRHDAGEVELGLVELSRRRAEHRSRTRRAVVRAEAPTTAFVEHQPLIRTSS